MTEIKDGQPFPGDEKVENARMFRSIDHFLNIPQNDYSLPPLGHLKWRIGSAVCLGAFAIYDYWEPISRFILKNPPIIF